MSNLIEYFISVVKMYDAYGIEKGIVREIDEHYESLLVSAIKEIDGIVKSKTVNHLTINELNSVLTTLEVELQELKDYMRKES